MIPEGAVVVAGSRPVTHGPGASAGIQLYCPVIVKYRDEKTSGSIRLEDLLRYGRIHEELIDGVVIELTEIVIDLTG